MINVQQLMQQAQKMQKQIAENQEKMKNTEFTGESGNDKVLVTMNGNYDVLRVKISPTIIDAEDPEILEDLLVVAFNNCKKKIDEENSSNIGNITGGAGGFDSFLR